MTDQIDDGNDALVSADFEDEVRRMLRRRAADVPDGEPADHGATGPVDVVGPAVDEVTLLTSAVEPVPWHRRIGVLAAVAAVVVAVVGIGVAGWIDDPDQQVAVGGPPAAGPTVLVPPEGDAFALDRIDVSSLQESPFADLEYGPVDGDVTEGITILIEAASDDALSGGTPVTPEQSEILAGLGAVFEAPTVISWRDPAVDAGAPSSVAVLWYGSSLTSEQGLAIAAAVAPDPHGELDGGPLPPGWALRSTSVAGEPGAPAIDVVLSGPWPAIMASIPGEFSLGLWLIDWDGGDSPQDAREVEVRGGPGLLVERTIRDDDGTVFRRPSLVWHEGGVTYALGAAAPTDEDVDLVGLAERLIAVGLDEAQGRTGQAAETTVGPIEPTVTTASLAPMSMTAPGPGAIENPTATTGPAGQTTVPQTATTEPPPLTTEGAGGSTVVISTTEPLARPAGEFLANAIVPVTAGTIGSKAYEVGVVWSPTFGFCMGVDLDGAMTEGGFPVECETEPLIGGAGSRLVPGEGALVFAFADAATTAATVDIDGVTGEADVYRVPEFPDFSLLVFTLEADIPAPVLLAADLPGSIALFDQTGQPIGWG